MRIPRVHIQHASVSKSTLVLSKEQSHYITKVLRLKIDSPVIVFNGQNKSYFGIITDLTKRNEVQVYLDHDLPGNLESSLHISLGQVLSRGERFDWVIQKATELGVSEITPLVSERCGVRLQTDKQEKRMAHWRNIAISACEQCGRNQVPLIYRPVLLESWLTKRKTDQNFVLDPQGKSGFQKEALPKSVSLLIGPEGGISAEELNIVKQYQFQSIQLGPRILRTETAPLASISIMQFLWGDLN